MVSVISRVDGNDPTPRGTRSPPRVFRSSSCYYHTAIAQRPGTPSIPRDARSPYSGRQRPNPSTSESRRRRRDEDQVGSGSHARSVHDLGELDAKMTTGPDTAAATAGDAMTRPASIDRRRPRRRGDERVTAERSTRRSLGREDPLFTENPRATFPIISARRFRSRETSFPRYVGRPSRRLSIAGAPWSILQFGGLWIRNLAGVIRSVYGIMGRTGPALFAASPGNRTAFSSVSFLLLSKAMPPTRCCPLARTHLNNLDVERPRDRFDRDHRSLVSASRARLHSDLFRGHAATSSRCPPTPPVLGKRRIRRHPSRVCQHRLARRRQQNPRITAHGTRSTTTCAPLLSRTAHALPICGREIGAIRRADGRQATACPMGRGHAHGTAGPHAGLARELLAGAKHRAFVRVRVDGQAADLDEEIISTKYSTRSSRRRPPGRAQTMATATAPRCHPSCGLDRAGDHSRRGSCSQPADAE